MKQVDAPPEAGQDVEGRSAAPQPAQKLPAESTSRRFGQLSDPRLATFARAVSFKPSRILRRIQPAPHKILSRTSDMRYSALRKGVEKQSWRMIATVLHLESTKNVRLTD